ncbi:uncharacterized protein LOC131946999 [Physella acuta]|uniref:uncharacterized protein LOC131946999 n=1 Tax=Physella acuta TaxID=109671 RepID=UPI0027DBB6DE|nr:uncharacterized protein LOC131946999 [Physella acuta]
MNTTTPDITTTPMSTIRSTVSSKDTTPTTLQSAIAAVPSTKEPTTSQPNYTSFDKENSRVAVVFTIKFNKDFNPSLVSPETTIYMDTVRHYTAVLTPVYKDVLNFDKIVITNFWPGSIGIDYQVHLKAFSHQQPVDVIKVSQQLADTKQRLLDLDNVDKTYVNSTFNQNLDDSLHVLEEFSRDVCRSKHICNDTYVCNSTSQVCDHKCFNFRCPVNAECYVTDQHIPQCRCSDGADCSSAGSTSGLTTTHIVAVGAGVGGAVVVIIVIIALIVCLKRRPSHNFTVHTPRDQRSHYSLKTRPEVVMMTSYQRPSSEIIYKL